MHSMDSTGTSSSSKKDRSHHHQGGHRQPSAHDKHRKNDEPGSALFTLLDHMKERGVGKPSPGASSAGPSKPTKIRRDKNGDRDDPPIHHRRSDDRTTPADTLGYRGASEPLPSPKLDDTLGDHHHSHHSHHHRSSSKRRKEEGEGEEAMSTSSASMNNSNIRMEAHNRSKALAEGMPSSTRGKLNLTPTKVDQHSNTTTTKTSSALSPSASSASLPVGKKQPVLSEPSRPRVGTGVVDADTRSNGVVPHRSKSQTSRVAAAEPSSTSSSHNLKARSSSSTKRPTEPLKDAPSSQNYSDKATWNTHISKSVLQVLNGRSLEEPFTTHLWKQAYPHPEEEEDQQDRYDENCDERDHSCNPHIHQYQGKNRDGYYACIRCKAPICSPKYQVVNEERGIAAFQHLNAEALDIEIDVSGNAVRGKKMLRLDPDEQCNIHFLAFCASCHGCLGVCTMEVPSSMVSDVTSGELFYANSCCLVYQRYRTTANLKGVIVGMDGLEERDKEQGLLDDDDLDELQWNDDFGLNINDFDSDDGEGARRPVIDFPSEEEEDY